MSIKNQSFSNTIKVYKLIQSFRSRYNHHLSLLLSLLLSFSSLIISGHFAATLDPLSSRLSWLPSDQSLHPDIVRLLKDYPKSLDLKPFELENVCLNTKFDIADEIKAHNINKLWTIKELIDFLVKLYCGNVGVEFAHIESERERTWLYEKIEMEFGIKGWSYATIENQRNTLGN